ncbi:MAG: plastocyanin/azurin family copper-binding protein [Solirubrobacterales bacterium]
MALAALALVACGGSSNNTTTNEETAGGASAGKEETSEGGKEAEGGSGESLKVEANPEGNLEFVQKSLTAKAGTDTLEFTNESPVPHDVKIENSKGEEVGGTEIVSEGSESASVELEPGTYTFFCSIPGHRQAGMEGTLTVK